MTHPPSSRALALKIVRQLQAAGHITYWAGGCVRDQLMQLTPKDYDVATAARPEEVLRLFPRSQKVGAAFGVILVKEKGRQVEVATFRADGAYSDGRHPDSVHFTTPEQDAARRDFTCNGLFFDPVTEALHDFVGGRRDIEARVLRAIGDPGQRFAEDHLRLLRAVRFAARLEFSIEDRTFAAMIQLQTHIGGISRERIGEEIRMMLEHPSRSAAISILAGLEQLFTETLGFAPLAHARQSQWPALSGLPRQCSRVLSLAAILLDNRCADFGAAANLLRHRLMLSNQETEELLWLGEKLPALERWESLPKSALKRLMADSRWPDLDALYRADPENAPELFVYSERTSSMAAEGVAPVPLITGDMLIQLGAPPGPSFKKWLDILYDQQLQGDFPTPESALAAAKRLLQT